MAARRGRGRAEGAGRARARGSAARAAPDPGRGSAARPTRPGPGPRPERPPSALQPRRPAGGPWRPSAPRRQARAAGAPRPAPPAGTPRLRPRRCPRPRRALPWAAALRAWSSRPRRSPSRGRGRPTFRCQRTEPPKEKPGRMRLWLLQPSQACPPAPFCWGPQPQPSAQSPAWRPGRSPWCSRQAATAAAAAGTGAGTRPVSSPPPVPHRHHCPRRRPTSCSGSLPLGRGRRQAEPEQSDGEEDFYYTELDVGLDTLTDGLSSLTPDSPVASTPPAFPHLELPGLLHPLALPPPPVLSSAQPPQACHSDHSYQEAPRRRQEVSEGVRNGAPGPVVHGLPLEEGLPALPGLSAPAPRGPHARPGLPEDPPRAPAPRGPHARPRVPENPPPALGSPRPPEAPATCPGVPKAPTTSPGPGSLRPRTSRPSPSPSAGGAPCPQIPPKCL
ncbi:SLC2A4 regulator isoform X1 [Rousettus aegyptiacus]|uniref:SLC2A4 regulator isoform X1 n=1 Tax=Rousettus aegyptiacus TaxID=9407 RepID=UPI00168D19EF|nr:SLC2A4 regulator isoform X1 [Rousettus aegyptiacus]